MNTVKEEVAQNLLFFRKRANMTQKELADKLGVKNNTISQWESGTNSIDIEVLFNISQILGVTITDMYGHFASSNRNTKKPTLKNESGLTGEDLDVLTSLSKDKLDIVLSVAHQMSQKENEREK